MKNKRFRAVIGRMLRLYARHHLPRGAAGLSYFLTLTFFPMLICLHTMLGSLFPGTGEVRGFLAGLLPAETVDTILDYLRYVSENLSTTMLVAALMVLATASSAGFRVINGVITAMRGEHRFTDVFVLVFSFVMSLLFLTAIYLAALLIVTGRWFLNYADRHIMFVNISGAWSWARFVILFLLLFAIISAVYRVTAPRRPGVRLLPGAAGASVALVVVSILFSAFITASSRYPLVYGSLASIIIMMIWLYFCSLILFLGAALNVALEQTAKHPPAPPAAERRS